MIRFTPGNAIELLRSGGEFFPALIAAIDAAQREVWIETYIFADDAVGKQIAEVLVRAAGRGVAVRVLVDGWGAKLYLTRRLERALREGGVHLMKYRPEVAPWQFRSHRLRRLHRKLCHVDCEVAFVGGINIIDDMNTPHQKPPRLDFAVRRARSAGRADRADDAALVGPGRARAARAKRGAAVPRADHRSSRAGNTVAKFVIRDNLRYRRDIERAYLAAIRTAKREIVIANAYFFPGVRFRRALIAAADRGVNVTLLLQARVEYRLLHYASRALYGQLLDAGVSIAEYHRSFLHAKVAVVDDHWATVGSSNIDPYSLLMAREANVFVRDAHFADQLRIELLSMIETGTRPVERERWGSRNPLVEGAHVGRLRRRARDDGLPGLRRRGLVPQAQAADA